MTKHHPETTNVSELTIPELQSRIVQARALVQQIRELLPGMPYLSFDERRHSHGKFQVGEVEAMKNLLVAAGKHPHFFVALADKDGGVDPGVFEPQPAIDDLDRIAAFEEITHEVEALARMMTDTLLVFGADAREVAVPVHAIIRANKALDPALATDAAEGLEFFAANGRRAARARAVAKAARETK